MPVKVSVASRRYRLSTLMPYRAAVRTCAKRLRALGNDVLQASWPLPTLVSLLKIK